MSADSADERDDVSLNRCVVGAESHILEERILFCRNRWHRYNLAFSTIPGRYSISERASAEFFFIVRNYKKGVIDKTLVRYLAG